MNYLEVSPQDVPIPLLLEADPSEDAIQRYLPGALCFIARGHQQVVAACIIKPMASGQAELCNISVLPGLQAKGIGTALLSFTLKVLQEKGFRRIELGTGSFGYQLTFYQRLGFRVESVVRDYFLDHYPEPLFEHGIQHKDRLILSLSLSSLELQTL